MMGPKPKPPKESRQDVVNDMMARLAAKYPDQHDQINILLSYFTTIDLVGIRDVLKGNK